MFDRRFVLVAGLFVAACGGGGEAPGEPATDASTATWAVVPPYAPLPTCAGQTTPGVCDWAQAHDVIAQARILDVVVSWDPAAHAAGGVQERVDPATCLALDPALRLRVRIVDVITGDVDSGTEHDVYVGADHVALFNELPTTRYPQTALRWRDPQERFAVGSDIVLAGFDVGGDAFSIWTAAPGVVDDGADTDVLDFPIPCSPEPFLGDGVTVDAFFAEVRACGEQSEASKALRRRWDVNAPRTGSLTPWRAARCHLAGD
ncbi:MAG TPA: hypothetical protein VGF99_02520 [Myxococcota bacterium]